MTYWERQTRTDVSIAIVLTVLAWGLPYLGAPIILEAGNYQSVARAWLGPVLTLMGVMGATTAFIFNVIEREEFKIIRGNRAESQLWRVFAQNIAWLAIGSAYCAFTSFAASPSLAWAIVGSFLLLMLVICIAKFAWVMRAVIFVRIERTS